MKCRLYEKSIFSSNGYVKADFNLLHQYRQQTGTLFEKLHASNDFDEQASLLNEVLANNPTDKGMLARFSGHLTGSSSIQGLNFVLELFYEQSATAVGKIMVHFIKNKLTILCFGHNFQNDDHKISTLTSFDKLLTSKLFDQSAKILKHERGIQVHIFHIIPKNVLDFNENNAYVHLNQLLSESKKLTTSWAIFGRHTTLTNLLSSTTVIPSSVDNFKYRVLTLDIKQFLPKYFHERSENSEKIKNMETLFHENIIKQSTELQLIDIVESDETLNDFYKASVSR